MRPHGRILLESVAPARVKNRLTTFSGDGQSVTYTYDATGNPANYGQGYSRTAQTSTITSTVATAYTYDAANRLTSAGGIAYTWDNNPTPLRCGDFAAT